jgi:hypothetical protein
MAAPKTVLRWAVRCGLAWGLAGALVMPTWASTEGLAGTLWWREPSAPAVAWRGMLQAEGGGVGNGTIIGPYPAFGVLGLLAAVLTHAAISQGVQSAERKREQETADKVLEPYQPSLQAWSSAQLWSAALALSAIPPAGLGSTGVGANAAPTPPGTPAIKTWDGKSPVAEGASIETLPVFTLTADHSALLLDAAVRLVPKPGAAPVSVLVRVVSSPLLDKDREALVGDAAQALWAADEARRLKDVAAGMLAQALHISLLQLTLPPDEATVATETARTSRAASRPDPSRPDSSRSSSTAAAPDAPGGSAAAAPGGIPTRTHRYLQGNTQRTERAQQLQSTCGRAVLRTLRGTLLSVPVLPTADSPCTVAASF